MPYQIRNGNEIWSASGGTWHRKQTCRNAEEAKKALRLLHAVENNSNFESKAKGGKK